MSGLTATEPFDRTRHRVDSFSCGHETLDRWLRAYAGQAQRRDAARTFVTPEADDTVAGYYTLVAAQVRHEAATTQVGHGVSPISRSRSRCSPVSRWINLSRAQASAAVCCSTRCGG